MGDLYVELGAAKSLVKKYKKLLDDKPTHPAMQERKALAKIANLCKTLDTVHSEMILEICSEGLGS